jgi:hypothetical protein
VVRGAGGGLGVLWVGVVVVVVVVGRVWVRGVHVWAGERRQCVLVWSGELVRRMGLSFVRLTTKVGRGRHGMLHQRFRFDALVDALVL